MLNIGRLKVLMVPCLTGDTVVPHNITCNFCFAIISSNFIFICPVNYAVCSVL